MDIAAIHALFLECTSVSIDTRKIQPNSFFVAIKGENFDANTFAKEALEKATYLAIRQTIARLILKMKGINLSFI